MVTKFKLDERLQVTVPVEMRTQNPDGVAIYSNFRRFDVSTDTVIPVPRRSALTSLAARIAHELLSLSPRTPMRVRTMFTCVSLIAALVRCRSCRAGFADRNGSAPASI